MAQAQEIVRAEACTTNSTALTSGLGLSGTQFLRARQFGGSFGADDH